MNDVRERHFQALRRRRTLNGVAAVGALVAIGAFTVAAQQYFFAPDPVLEVEDAITEAPPDTIPTDAANVDREAPQSVTIGSLSLWGPVSSVGIEDDGTLEVPDETEIGWYKYGSAPGLPGATVLAAHVTWNRTVAPFFKLGKLEPGELIDVRLQDDSLRQYEVVERTMYLKDELPRERIWRTTGDETLVLITCGGSYNSNIRRYRHNIVVYAVPVATPDQANVDAKRF